MTRDPLPLYIEDTSAFAKALRAGLAAAAEPPSHQAMLGLIAKAAGHRNFQALKASAEAPPGPSPLLDRALRVFDDAGRMTRWPAQTQVQGLCLWAVWHRLPPARDLSEAEVNDFLREIDGFGDHVLMRRSLIDHRLVARTVDGRVYRRIEQRPPDEARALIRALMRRG